MWRTICFHYGGPPLPDVSDMALDKLVLYYMLNGPIGSISNLQNAEQCYLLQKNMTIKLTSQQITPGVYYIGLFNGLGPLRTQSKMINRGSAYTFSANITVKGCLHPRMWGENCTQEVDHLSLVQSDPDGLGSEGARRYNQNVGSIAYSNRTLCTKNFDQNVYSLAVTEAVEQVRIIAKDIRSSEASYFSSRNSSEFSIMLYARYNAIPDKTLHHYTTDISKDPQVIHLPWAEQRWHSIFLIASNAAALLPAFKLLQQKACADWVIFMSSGIASAFYHTCDVGSWCALSFKPLQFMDFWLSFWAVVSTFVYLTVLSEAVKRTIHTVAVIITALLAANGATKSTNIVIVLAIGASAFLVGWLIQLSTRYKSFSFQSGSSLTIPERMAIFRHFRWGYVLLGFIAMSMAASSWTKENSQTYWIWHSIWHISIYTAAFFFVCSKAKTQKVDNQEAPAAASYELTRQNSSP
uniref:Uncharacterized protein n=1 Tax=Fagus sylvatica TaxID=28930 RepID=A0A2N9FV88_FAGSY